MNWIELIRDLGVFSIFTYVIEKIVENSASRKLESYKTKLDLEAKDYQQKLDSNLENYKNELNIIFNKKSLLQEKRLSIIDELYKKLVLLDSSMRTMVGINPVIEDVDREKAMRAQRVQEAFGEFNDYFLLNKHFFPKDIANSLEDIRRHYNEAQWDLFEADRLNNFTNGAAPDEAMRQALKNVNDAVKKIRTEMPNKISEIENKFRELLGV